MCILRITLNSFGVYVLSVNKIKVLFNVNTYQLSTNAGKTTITRIGYFSIFYTITLILISDIGAVVQKYL